MLSGDGTDMWITTWLTLQEAAKHLRMGKLAIYKLAGEGESSNAVEAVL